LIDRVLDEPSYVEKGLQITAMNVPIEYHDLEIQVDLIGEDADDQLVLINVIESASREKIERKVNQLQTLLKEAEVGEDRATRGLVIVGTVTEDAGRQQTLDTASGDSVEVRQAK
jgi:RecB family endonuclease NucS